MRKERDTSGPSCSSEDSSLCTPSLDTVTLDTSDDVTAVAVLVHVGGKVTVSTADDDGREELSEVASTPGCSCLTSVAVCNDESSVRHILTYLQYNVVCWKWILRVYMYVHVFK